MALLHCASIAIFFGVELTLKIVSKILRPRSCSDWSVKIFGGPEVALVNF